MPPAQVPSLELLRALRRTACSVSHQSHRSPCLLRPQTHRLFTTTSTHNAANNSPPSSRPKPSTYPPTPSSPSPTSSTISTPSQPSNTGKTNRYAPSSHDRGPTSEEDTQTDFGIMDIYANVPQPATSIDACTTDGFHLDNGTKITNFAGLLVAGGEAWSWRPWLALSQSQSSSTTKHTTATASSEISQLLDPKRGILTLPKQSLGLFSLLHPKPDLLILGTGAKLWMISPETKKYIMQELGMRVDVMDTGNASAAYNLLAKERGVEGGAGVGGIFLPIGWKGPEVKRRR